MSLVSYFSTCCTHPLLATCVPAPVAAGNTFYTTSQLAGMQDVDQRLTRDIGGWGATCRACLPALAVWRGSFANPLHVVDRQVNQVDFHHTLLITCLFAWLCRAAVRRPGRPDTHPGQAGG